MFSLGVARWEWQELEFERHLPVSTVAFAVQSIMLAVVGAVDVYRILAVPCSMPGSAYTSDANRGAFCAAAVTGG